MSLRLRLALFGAAVVALALVIFGLALYGLVARSVETNQDKDLHARAAAAAATLATTPGVELTPRPVIAPVDLSRGADRRRLSHLFNGRAERRATCDHVASPE